MSMSSHEVSCATVAGREVFGLAIEALRKGLQFMVTRRTWLAGLGAGSLTVAGTFAAGQLDGSVLRAVAVAAQTDDDTGDEGNGSAIVGAPLLQPEIDLIQAQEIALEDQGEAVVVAVNLDGDNGVLAYDVLLDNGFIVEIDATSGEILRAEERAAQGIAGDDGGTDDGDDGAGAAVGGDDDADDGGAPIIGDDDADDGGGTGAPIVGDDDADDGGGAVAPIIGDDDGLDDTGGDDGVVGDDGLDDTGGDD